MNIRSTPCNLSSCKRLTQPKNCTSVTMFPATRLPSQLRLQWRVTSSKRINESPTIMRAEAPSSPASKSTTHRLLTGMATLTSLVEMCSLVACVLCCAQLLQMHGQSVSAAQQNQPAVHQSFSASPPNLEQQTQSVTVGVSYITAFVPLACKH